MTIINSAATHNLLDGKAEGKSYGADVVIYTEAPANIFKDSVNETHVLFRPKQQRDLVIALKESLAEAATEPLLHYRKVHGGVVKVTPQRGIFWITFMIFNQKYAIIAEHRINAWFRPWIRGERWLRERFWRKFDRMSEELIADLLDEGYIVIAGGDPNAPEGVKAYSLLHETYEAHMDRIASNLRLVNVEVDGPYGGSDHRVVRAGLRPRKAA